MTPDSPRGLAPDLFGQLAATDPIQRRTRRLFGRGRVEVVNGNQADLLVGYDAQGNPMRLKEVPIISGYVPRVGDWVAIQYEGGHAGAPWVAGPSISQEGTADSAGIGVFPVSQEAPDSPQASMVYFDDPLRVWRGYDGAKWVDFSASDHGGLGGLQGGAPGEYYHLTAAEYAGTWGHQLIAISGEQCPLEGVRTTDETAIGQSGVLAKALSSGDMTDGFGAGYAFAIQDNAAVENIIAAIYGIRDGADNTGALLWKTATAGALVERMRLTATGLGIGTNAPAQALHAYLAQASTAHPLHVGDGTYGILMGGGTTVANRMSPLIGMYPVDNNDGGGMAFLLSQIDAASDVGTNPVFRLDGRRAGALLVTRPVLGVYNYSSHLLDIMPGGQLHGVLGSAGAPTYSFLGRATDGIFSPAAGVVGVTAKLRLEPVGNYAQVQTDAVRGLGFFTTASAAQGIQARWIRVSDGFSVAIPAGHIFLKPNADAPGTNGQVAQSSTYNALVGRVGDTTTRFGGTVKNLDSELAEFLSSGGLTQTLWSDPVDKDLWVTGKPINVFAATRVQVPAAQAGANYSCTVEILLGTEVICGHTLQHTYAVGESSSYYYLELRSRVTKYAGTSLRNIASIRRSEAVAIASWSEGAHLELTEYAEGRADPVTEDVTSANVTLQVRVTFSHLVAGLKCKLMDAGWGPETPVI